MKIASTNKKKCEPQAGKGDAASTASSELQVFEIVRDSSRHLCGSAVMDELKERTARTELKTEQVRLVGAVIGAALALCVPFGVNSHSDTKTVQEVPRVVVNEYYYPVVQPNMFNAYAKEEFKK